MDTNRLNKLLEDGTTGLDPALTRELTGVIDEYPYFQAARAVQLKGLYQQGSLLYNQALKKTAAYTTDRSVLFDYITSEAFQQHSVAVQIKKRHEEEKAAESEAPSGIMSEEEAALILTPDLFEEAAEENAVVDSSAVPVQFDKSQSHTFSEWLKLTAMQPLSRLETEDLPADEKQKKERVHEIIDRFIKESPKIIPSEQKPDVQIKLREYAIEDSLMTETLAKIYEEQRQYDKAMQAYKILILKNPEKSGLFANRIYEIKKLKEKENKKK